MQRTLFETPGISHALRAFSRTVLRLQGWQLQGGLPAGFGPSSPLKAYMREAADLPRMAALLSDRLPPGTPHLLLHGEVCRRELLVEIDGFHGP